MDKNSPAAAEPAHEVDGEPFSRTRHPLSLHELSILRALLEEPPGATGIAGDRWSPARVALLLKNQFQIDYSPRHAVRVLRARGITLNFKRAREARLTLAQIAQLRELVARPPSAVGLRGECWSRKRLAQLVEARYGVRYSPQYIGRLARMLKLGVHMTRRERRLTGVQAEELRALLSRTENPAQMHPTRSEVVALIAQRFGVRYHPHSIQRLLKRWQITLQTPDARRLFSRLNPQQLAQLRTALEGTPHENGIAGNVWTQQRLSRWIELRFGVHYRPYTLNRTLARLGLKPLHRAKRGGAPSLNTDQAAILASVLKGSPREFGRSSARWSRREVAELIRERFHVRYAPASVPRLLRRLGMRLAPTVPSPPPFRESASRLSGTALSS